MVSAITATKTAEMTIATANDPSAALTWLSRVLAFIRAKRAPISAPMPTSAMPRTQGGRPPSTSPAPCSTLEPIIAPNIQLAGNLISRSSSATATEAAISSASSSGEAIGIVDGRRRRRGDPGQRQQHRQRRGENDHAHGLHHGDRRHVGALLGGEHGDLRQRAGASGQKRRGPVPAVDALQIDAAAEGRAERRQRQQRDGQGIGADMLQQLPRHQRAQRNPEQHQHRSGSGSAAPRAAGPAIAAMPTAIMAPEISPPGSCAHKNSAPPAAPIASVSSTLRVLARLGMANAIDAGMQAHAALWQIRACGGQMRQRDCSNARRVLPCRRGNRRRARHRSLGLPGGATRRPSLARAEGEADQWASLLRCQLCGLLAFGAEFLALLAM